MLRAHRRAHRVVWAIAALVIPVILVVGWLSRPSARLPDPVRIDATGAPSR